MQNPHFNKELIADSRHMSRLYSRLECWEQIQGEKKLLGDFLPSAEDIYLQGFFKKC